MPSPLGEGQTDTPINGHNRGEVELPFIHSPVLIVEEIPATRNNCKLF
jgi:hypothetical protein